MFQSVATVKDTEGALQAARQAYTAAATRADAAGMTAATAAIEQLTAARAQALREAERAAAMDERAQEIAALQAALPAADTRLSAAQTAATAATAEWEEAGQDFRDLPRLVYEREARWAEAQMRLRSARGQADAARQERNRITARLARLQEV